MNKKRIFWNLYPVPISLNKGIRDIRNLFDLSIDENYSKPIRTNSAFNGNYIEYESIGDKNETLTMKEYLDLMRLVLYTLKVII